MLGCAIKCLMKPIFNQNFLKILGSCVLTKYKV